MDAVSHYLNQILAPRLRSYGVSERFLLYTIDTINTQMTSLLRHWDDRVFRNTVLLLGLEEGSYYEPPCKIDVRCFVVVTIRNSPIETIQSDAYAEAGLSKYLSSQGVKEITSEAIRYFSTQDFSMLSKQARSSVKADLYSEIKHQHPIAWTALEKIAMTSAKAVDYSKVSFSEPFSFDGWAEDTTKTIEKTDFDPIIFDAYTPEFDSNLLQILQAITSTPGSALVVDAFKVISRNANKLMDVIELLLTRDHALVTTNYYLTNGHVERRIKPLRAAHTIEEMKLNFTQTDQLGYRHKAELKQYLKQLQSQ